MNKPIIRVFPRRTSYTPDDELAFVGMPAADVVKVVRCKDCENYELMYSEGTEKGW